MKDIFDIDYVKNLTSEGRDEEAFNYCLGFAKQGDAEAQNRIGNYYFNGLGVPKDNVKAAEWYKKAAELGNSTAMNNLAVCYIRGVISALPKLLRYYDAKNGQWILSDPEHFALGQIPYIFGQKGIKGNDQKDIELLMFLKRIGCVIVPEA